MSRRIHGVGQTGYFVDPAGATLKEVGQRMQLDSTTCPTAFLVSPQTTYHQLLCAHVVTRSVVDLANLVKKLLLSPGWNMLPPAVTDLLDQVRNYGAFIKIEAVRCSRHLSLPLFQLAFCRHTTCPVTKMVQVDPFARSIPQTYLTMVLAFAGNDLTVQAAMVPPVDAGKLLSQDRIRRGAISLFSG